MSLEISYNLRHLFARKTTSSLTVAGIALVVVVYVATLMLAEGLKRTLVSTGSDLNAIVIRNGAENEIQSGLKRDDVAVILSQPEVERLPDNTPQATKDCLVVVSLKKRSDGQPSNVNLRGISNTALGVRGEVHILEGRMPNPGTREVMVGTAIHRKFRDTDIGKNIRLAGTDWPVVGIFDAGNSAFSSEIWGDVEVLMPSFKRQQFSSVTFRLRPDADFGALEERLKNDPRMSVVIRHEKQYYESQSRVFATFITFMGTAISFIFSLGAIVGALITMYSAVSTRTREIGILRALGFKPVRVFVAFTTECLMIALMGGSLGVLLALLLTFMSVTTTNFQTFSEISFRFYMTPAIALQGITFALIMGVLGGALPALRAARVQVLQALRE